MNAEVSLLPHFPLVLNKPVGARVGMEGTGDRGGNRETEKLAVPRIPAQPILSGFANVRETSAPTGQTVHHFL